MVEIYTKKFDEIIYRTSLGYIRVASNIIKNLKGQELALNSIELSFDIKLAVTGEKFLSWIFADAEEETYINVMMK